MNQIVGITGATGVLGRIMCSQLDEKKVTYVRFSGDICNKTDVDDFLDKNELTHIIHLAALVPTKSVVEDPLKAYTVNVGGTVNLLNSIVERKLKPWFFYASSSHVYKSKETPLCEEDVIEPISLYGMTKYMGEKICTLARK